MSTKEALQAHLATAERALHHAAEVAGIAQGQMQANADGIAADVQRAMAAVSEAKRKTAEW